jgi:thiol:disulfide interchange protein DsbA
VDGAKFGETLKSFTVIGKAKQARQLADAYAVDGVPTVGIHGRYRTSPTLTGGIERTFTVVDFLVGQVRKTL